MTFLLPIRYDVKYQDDYYTSTSYLNVVFRRVILHFTGLNIPSFFFNRNSNSLETYIVGNITFLFLSLCYNM